jgi:hypothetical protein
MYSEVDEIEARVNSKERRGLTKKEEEKERVPTTLDTLFLSTKAKQVST